MYKKFHICEQAKGESTSKEYRIGLKSILMLHLLGNNFADIMEKMRKTTAYYKKDQTYLTASRYLPPNIDRSDRT